MYVCMYVCMYVYLCVSVPPLGRLARQDLDRRGLRAIDQLRGQHQAQERGDLGRVFPTQDSDIGDVADQLLAKV